MKSIIFGWNEALNEQEDLPPPNRYQLNECNKIQQR